MCHPSLASRLADLLLKIFAESWLWIRPAGRVLCSLFLPLLSRASLSGEKNKKKKKPRLWSLRIRVQNKEKTTEDAEIEMIRAKVC